MAEVREVGGEGTGGRKVRGSSERGVLVIWKKGVQNVGVSYETDRFRYSQKRKSFNDA